MQNQTKIIKIVQQSKAADIPLSRLANTFVDIKNNHMTQQIQTPHMLTAEKLLTHWQGHRTLTRKVIDAFPEKELFDFSIGGMRTFSQLAAELIAIAGPGLKGIVHKEVAPYNEEALDFKTKAEILEQWDKETIIINEYFPQISSHRFQETFNLFGEYEFPIIDNILYFIDNEIHHRAQGYVYLRALKIEPPFFWDR